MSGVEQGETSDTGREAETPRRVQRFVTYFKNYMGLSTLVAAALPVPFTALGVFPVYGSQKAMLGLYTSLFCFLCVAFIFYNRHVLARFMFRRDRDRVSMSTAATVAPLLCVVLAVLSLAAYQYLLDRSISVARAQLLASSILNSKDADSAGERFIGARQMLEVINDTSLLNSGATARKAKAYLVATPGWQPRRADVFKESDADEIPFAGALLFCCLAVFVSAEAAFVIMALREYLQDLLKISEGELIGPLVPTPDAEAAA